MAWLSRNESAAGISQERRLRWPITRVMDLQKVVLALPGGKTQDAGLATGGMQQTGEHLERGGFAGAVRAEKTDDLAGLDGEADLLDGVDIGILAAEKTAHRRAEAAFAFGHLVGLAELFDIDCIVHSQDL